MLYLNKARRSGRCYQYCRIDENSEQVLLETCHCMLRNIIRNQENDLAIYAEWRNQVENGGILI